MCRDRGTRLVPVGDAEVAAVSADDLARFTYLEHRENVALALAVCAELGIPRAVALEGMSSAEPDIGALREFEIDFFGRHVVFVNGFAANDPIATERVWNLALARHGDRETRLMVLNCRLDRSDRSRQLGDALPRWAPADQYFLVGTGTFALARSAVRAGLPAAKLVPLEGEPPEAVFEELIGAAGTSALVVGAGKHRGNRARAAALFREPGSAERARCMTDTEVLVIGIGLVVSLLYSELFGVAPGGIIVPGYLALAISEPITVALTLGVALLTWFVVRVLGTIAIVYGRRRNVLAILIGFGIGALARTMVGAGTPFGGFGIDVVGYVVPGLLAIWMDRQGVAVTVTSAVTASIATRLAGLCGWGARCSGSTGARPPRRAAFTCSWR